MQRGGPKALAARGVVVRMLSVLVLLFCLEAPHLAFSLEVESRLGLFSQRFESLPENDVKAALRVWLQKISEAENIPMDSEVSVFRDNPQTLEALQKGEVGGLITTFEQFYELNKKVEFAHLFLTELEGTYQERMLLVARKNGRVKGLADLRGGTLNRYKSSRTVLGLSWLGLELHKAGLPPLEQLVTKVTDRIKLTDAVLPVFFGKVDAVLVNENGFTVMKELNPQLAQDLVVVAESEPLVPVLLAFLKDFQPDYLPDLLAVLEELDNTPAGRQILLLFQCDAISEKPPAMLDSSIRLLRDFQQIE